MRNTILNEDCISGLDNIGENSIDVCITDPPYNYEFVGHKWDHEEIERRINRVKDSNTLVKHMPYGSGLAGGVRNERWYEKNAQNIREYRQWTFEWAQKVFRVLKPGSFILVFNSTRTIAHVQVALEDAGFYARDVLVWRRHSGIPKGMNLSKKLEKDGVENAKGWEGWHSALRNEWEAIALLQKPLEDNYMNTVAKWGVGVLNAINADGSFQSNILENIKRDRKESFNVHCTVKPVGLIKKLIELTVPLEPEKLVLDPFMGSGTTAIAALECGISYIGFEIVPNYCKVAETRVESFAAESIQARLL
jgi:site-specific DNA-methyltransferase (adenine-specific)